MQIIKKNSRDSSHYTLIFFSIFQWLIDKKFVNGIVVVYCGKVLLNGNTNTQKEVDCAPEHHIPFY